MVYNCNGAWVAGGGLSASPVLAEMAKENKLHLRPVNNKQGANNRAGRQGALGQAGAATGGRACVLHDAHFCPPPCWSKRVTAPTSTSPYLEAVRVAIT